MKNLSKSDKLILVGLSFLIVIFLYYQFLLNPLLNNISDTKFKIKDNASTIEKLEKMETDNRKMKKSINELKTKYEEFTKSLPSELRDPEIQSFLSSSAEVFKVNILSTAYGNSTDVVLWGEEEKGKSKKNEPENEKGKLKLVSVNVNMEGSYLDIMRYIYHLEHFQDKEDGVSELAVNVPDTVKNNIRINEVKSINIVKRNSSDNVAIADHVSAGIVINYYYVIGDEEDKKNIKFEVPVPAGTGENLFN
jgi:Tfp pilus assembly protein PilO